MKNRGYLGIDAGTQGLSVIWADEDLNVVATGEGSYEMVAGLGAGCYEQLPVDWESALTTAMQELRSKLASGTEIEVLAIGIAGQMHGEVLADDAGNILRPARLWCDARNEAEGDELSTRFGVKMPKRITTARWLWTIRNHPDIARSVAHLTTPAGWLAYQLTGQWDLGVGDAAGMFPIAQSSFDYRQDLLESFDELVANAGVKPLGQLLPTVRRVGEDGGTLKSNWAERLGLPVGIPVAPAEGDQPASLASSLIAAAGMVSVSFGTSVAANSVGDRDFSGVSAAVDHFCAPDGKPINMVCLRNGTTYMNTLVEMFAAMQVGSQMNAAAMERDAAFASIMPQVISAAPDCGGLLALPFMDDEPPLGISSGGTAMLLGLNSDNATPGNVVKAGLLSTMFNLKIGSQVLDDQGFPRTELVLSGGLTKTPELGQMLADVFQTPVTMMESASEGCAWGAALMAKFRHGCLAGSTKSWTEFLGEQTGVKRRFEPDSKAAQEYQAVYQRYQKLIASNQTLSAVIS